MAGPGELSRSAVLLRAVGRTESLLIEADAWTAHNRLSFLFPPSLPLSLFPFPPAILHCQLMFDSTFEYLCFGLFFNKCVGNCVFQSKPYFVTVFLPVHLISLQTLQRVPLYHLSLFFLVLQTHPKLLLLAHYDSEYIKIITSVRLLLKTLSKTKLFSSHG